MSLKQNETLLETYYEAYLAVGGKLEDIEHSSSDPNIIDELTERIRRLSHLTINCSACGKEWMVGVPPKELHWVCENCEDDFEENNDELMLKNIVKGRGINWIKEKCGIKSSKSNTR